ncbi:hypothetical protein [Spiroplasma endosymbiont of Aspidapion aeneum]|uniref:hypothetical protein n=1 Tax=Spiroplasma endosymbiont of Aspidapion aeneum TaxID=3066276 RepID=UPI00313DEC7C
MKRSEKNRELYHRINQEISDIEKDLKSTEDLDEIFAALKVIDVNLYSEVLKLKDLNKKSTDPYVEPEKTKYNVDESIKIKIKKILSELQPFKYDNDDEKDYWNSNENYTFNSKDYKAYNDTIEEEKKLRSLRENKSYDIIAKAKKAAFDDIDTKSLEKFKLTANKKVAESVRDIMNRLDDATAVAQASYKLLNRKQKKRQYVWIYISVFLIMVICAILLLVIK